MIFICRNVSRGPNGNLPRLLTKSSVCSTVSLDKIIARNRYKDKDPLPKNPGVFKPPFVDEPPKNMINGRFRKGHNPPYRREPAFGGFMGNYNPFPEYNYGPPPAKFSSFL